MPLDTTILQERIERVRAALDSGQFADVLVGALNTGNGLMQQRIFTEHKDIDGNNFGTYIGKKTKTKHTPLSNKLANKRSKAIEGAFLTSYQRKRARAGRGILAKDLEFTGDLRRSIETVVIDEVSASIEFNNTTAAQIARGQEAQITNIKIGKKGTTQGVGIKIFTLNSSEKEQVITQAQELIAQIMKA